MGRDPADGVDLHTVELAFVFVYGIIRDNPTATRNRNRGLETRHRPSENLVTDTARNPSFGVCRKNTIKAQNFFPAGSGIFFLEMIAATGRGIPQSRPRQVRPPSSPGTPPLPAIVVASEAGG